MNVFEDVVCEEDGYAIVGFINTQHELEYSIYKSIDGGIMDLENRLYSKEELSELLQPELESYMNRNLPVVFILGHDICIKLTTGEYVSRTDLDDEVYEISHSIMLGENCGDIYVEALKVKAFWSIVQ